MGAGTIRLILGEVEAEVVEEALQLYLLARPKAHDARYDRAYRVAHELLASLRHEVRSEHVGDLDGDDEASGRGQPVPRVRATTDD